MSKLFNNREATVDTDRLILSLKGHRIKVSKYEEDIECGEISSLKGARIKVEKDE